MYAISITRLVPQQCDYFENTVRLKVLFII